VSKEEQLAESLLTSEPIETILIHRGSGDWVLSPKKAGTCKYVICCRKAAWNNKRKASLHRPRFSSASLLASTSSPTVGNDRGQPRLRIEMSEYATFERPGVWKKKPQPRILQNSENARHRSAGPEVQADAGPYCFRETGEPSSGMMTMRTPKKALAGALASAPKTSKSPSGAKFTMAAFVGMARGNIAKV